jgi:hypothetical protein
MYSVRLLPLGVPVAAGLSATANGTAIVLSIIGLLLMLLLVRHFRLRTGADAHDTQGAPPT